MKWYNALFALEYFVVLSRITYDIKPLLTTLMVTYLQGSQRSHVFAGPACSLHQITEFCGTALRNQLLAACV